jgi:aminocarboxymuconate-semialdehyde decarboxylase
MTNPTQSSQPVIDIYNHVMPPLYMEELKKYSKDPGLLKRMSSLRLLWDIPARVEMLKKWPQVKQVLTLAVPSPEMLVDGDLSPKLARIANEGMYEMCQTWPDFFPCFAATLPMNNPQAALEEMDYAIKSFGARGVQVLSSVNGVALDHPDYFPIFERMANHHQLPVWMHPIRLAKKPDYVDEEKSRYEVWQVLGWPYETSVAMSRIVFSGLLEKLPNLKMITHHCGGMIPFFGGRAETLWAQLGSRSADNSEADVLKSLSKPPIDYFKMFYGDTVLGGSASALRCGLDFFGTEHVVFASDCPFDPEGGEMYIREGINSVFAVGLSPQEIHQVCCSNANELMKTTLFSGK